MKTGTFGYMVKHELRHRMSAWKETRQWWKWVYLSILVIAAVIGIGIWSIQDYYDPRYMLFFSYGVPYWSFMIAFMLIRTEWKNGTFGWWVTLPQSRLRLIGVKYTAALIQIAIIYILFLVLVLALALYGMLLNGSGPGILGELLNQIGLYVVIDIGVFPFMAALGALTAIVSQSKLKPIIPLLWATFGIAGNISWFYSGILWSPDGMPSSAAIPMWLLATIPVYWAVSAIIVTGAAGLMKKGLDL